MLLPLRLQTLCAPLLVSAALATIVTDSIAGQQVGTTDPTSSEGGTDAAQNPRDTPSPTGRLRDIRIEVRDVFTDAEAEENFFYRLVNGLHVPSDPEILRREVWFSAGDTVGDVEARELERVLRRTGWLGEVSAKLVPSTRGAADEVDLEIESRDRLSLLLNSTFSFAGGETRFDAAFGDRNLFGTGKTLAVDYRRTDIDETGSIRFVDPQFADTDHRLALSAGDTDEGAFFGAGVSRPFRNRFDPYSYGINGGFAESEIDFFERGDTVASIPQQRIATRAVVQHAFGPFEQRSSIGADLEFTDADFDPAVGIFAGDFRVPGDTTSLTLRAFASREWIDEFHKVRGLDAIDFDEDLRLGTSVSGALGAIYRDEDGRGGELQPTASIGFNTAISPAEDTYVTLAIGAQARWFGDRVRGYGASAALHGFQLSLPAQTLAASIAIDTVFETQGVPAQLTLGEDNGLRGFPAREFAGTRTLRINLEDRIRTGLELGSIHVGAVAFLDVAWIHSTRTGLSMSDAIPSAGVGLRFGSSNLLGGNVLRVDLAFPLDDVRGEDFGASISFAGGQVFSFFGRDSVLGN